jgi:hypothetical protein
LPALQRTFAAGHAGLEVVDLPGEQRTVLTRSVLAAALEPRLKAALASSGPGIVVRVTVVEAGVVSSAGHAVVDVAVEPDGVRVATTRGVSTLRGSLGGMDPRSDELVQLAVIDAFERCVLRPAFVDAVNGALGAGPRPGTPPTEVPETRDEWIVGPHQSSAAAHVLSATLDAGASQSVGLRYLHDHLSGGPGLFWGGYGVEGRLITDQFKRTEAAAALAVLRGGMLFEQGFSVEVGLGPGGGNGPVRPVGVAGAYLSLYFVDIGYTYQFVISPTPDLQPAMGSHFGVRINVPVAVHGRSVRCHSPLPCTFGLLPGFGDGKAAR